MQVELSDDERDALQSALDSALSDLSSEIADTDNVLYRRQLDQHRETLRAINAKLRP